MKTKSKLMYRACHQGRSTAEEVEAPCNEVSGCPHTKTGRSCRRITAWNQELI